MVVCFLLFSESWSLEFLVQTSRSRDKRLFSVCFIWTCLIEKIFLETAEKKENRLG